MTCRSTKRSRFLCEQHKCSRKQGHRGPHLCRNVITPTARCAFTWPRKKGAK
jgi:hypothetical protein